MLSSAPHTSYNTVGHEVSGAAEAKEWPKVALGAVCFCLGVACMGAVQRISSPVTNLAVTSSTTTQTSALAAWNTRAQNPSAVNVAAAYAQSSSNVEADVRGAGAQTVTAAQSGFSVQAALLAVPTAVAAVVLALKHVFMKPQVKEVAMVAVSAEPATYTDIEFPTLTNDRLLRAARGESLDRIPIWVMRQAGRYLPEYREFMSDKEFFAVCKDPKQVAEITLQPIDRYDLDGSIIFCDILVIPQAMGMAVSLVPEKGPVFEEPVQNKATWHKMQDKLLGELDIPIDSSMSSAEKTSLLVTNANKLVSPSLDYVYAAITETRKQLNGRVPLLGFCGAPMTLAIYMIEGMGSRTFSNTANLFLGDPETSHEMLTVLTHMCAHYLMNQVRGGAQMLQVFDSYAGALSPDVWMEFSYPYMKLIAEIVKKEMPDMPMICFAKDAHYALDILSETQYDVVALDSSLDLGSCHERMAAKGKAVQGNLDPTVLYAPPERITELVAEKLEKAFGDGSKIPTKYIANMGHGMNPDHDPEHLRAFIDAIHAFGQKEK